MFASLGLIALSAYILKEGSGWVVYGSEGPGPGFFPIMYGVIMLGLSLYLFQRSVRKGTGKSKGPLDYQGIARALATWAALAVCVPLMVVVGFVVGFGFVALFLIRFVFERSWRTSIITAVCIAIALHLVFPVMLDAPLPVGMLWGF
ncbi:tripartite tricarboxylate transporter TctB family protein [Starkeya sp. ORNL1]|uniref:tripartite tricarboxylate transporter TctB family protein n=1 Tax=Starkeya sp. ORNL1 TaxID=2709380 RepID=UPI0014643DA3|nr:tripartite tricarboxylate transporter TctB family protein [Starkeya sp. ORNL1]QJP15861.1 tripartite tricarboxylate transporter TctB family protein [Starkeya sp. ORNL1]